MSFENLILATLQASPGTVVPRADLDEIKALNETLARVYG